MLFVNYSLNPRVSYSCGCWFADDIFLFVGLFLEVPLLAMLGVVKHAVVVAEPVALFNLSASKYRTRRTLYDQLIRRCSRIPGVMILGSWFVYHPSTC